MNADRLHRLVTLGAVVALGALVVRHPGNPLVMSLEFWLSFETALQITRRL